MNCDDGSCNPWKRRDLNRIFEEFFGINSDFYGIQERMPTDFDEIFKRAIMGEGFVEGFTMIIEPEGKAEVYEYGNKPALGEGDEIVERKPLIDVIKDEREVHVIVEMPGVDEKDIYTNVSGTSVEITAEREGRNYFEKVELGCEVIPDSAKVTYNNGVLELIFKRKQPELGEK
jgi:HSP20 family protein